MLPEVPPKTPDRLGTHSDQTRGGLRRETLGQMLSDRDGLPFLDLTIEKSGVLPLRELAGTSATAQVADLILAVELTHGEIPCGCCGVEVAIGVGTS